MNFFTHAVLGCFALVLATDVVAQAEGENCWSSLPLRFPAGEATSVIQRTFDFLVKVEAVPVHPYWPEGASGVTIGVGWDLGQHDSDQLAKAWSALPKGDIDLLAQASGKKGVAASKVLPKLILITISSDVALDVLQREIRDVYYPATLKVFPGADLLPTDAQVALISVVFNRGAAMGRDPNWSTAMEVDRRWEMRRFRDDVRSRDMYAIYAHLGTMKRLWKTGKQRGLQTRRREEQALIRPYALQELRWEERREALKAKGAPRCATKLRGMRVKGDG